MPSEKNFFDKLLNGLFYISGVIVALITLSVCYNVFMRYLFKSPPLWVVQGTEYALLWIVFLSAAFLLREKGHISIDILYSYLKGKPKCIVDIIIFGLCFFFTVILTIFSILYLAESIKNHVMDVRTYTVPKYVVFSVVPFGSLILAIEFLRLEIKEIKRLWSGG